VGLAGQILCTPRAAYVARMLAEGGMRGNARPTLLHTERCVRCKDDSRRREERDCKRCLLAKPRLASWSLCGHQVFSRRQAYSGAFHAALGSGVCYGK